MCDKFRRLVAETDPGIVTKMLAADPALVHRLRGAATSSEAPAFSGSSNRMVRVGNLLVRFSSADRDRLDLRLLREVDVLYAIRPHLGEMASRLVYVGLGWSVHMFEEGCLLLDIAPRGQPVPRFLFAQLADFFSELSKVSHRGLLRLREWPSNGDTAAVGRCLGAYAARFNRPEFRDLGIPAEPLRPIRFEKLTRRPFQLLHGDLHRGNVIIRPTGLVVVDWELALIGDAVYDMATHLHLMGYSEEEEEAILGSWVERMPPWSIAGWQSDLPTYRQFGRVKSAIVDTIRVIKKFRKGGMSPGEEADLIVGLTSTLNAAGCSIWGWKAPLAPDQVATITRRLC
ncbi:hypothetical protein GCM10010191_43580 [Actinomadura vinacea]|uniref:Aminoglycoside phosphotransferase domain-containing protein n=1 Tax=Actinomadura vinacea TaxID=115336 RepID=A0ABP5WFL2_9ACTN